jgi:hypothetical protein
MKKIEIVAGVQNGEVCKRVLVSECVLRVIWLDKLFTLF